MSRKLLINIHLYLASFFAPFVVLVAVSGGLYLIGIKGSVETTAVYSGPGMIDTKSADLKADVDALLAQAGVADFSYEYVKVKGSTLYTRPTSRDHYIIDLGDGVVDVSYGEPSPQKRMIELHMGHGPTLFKTFQKWFSLAMLFIFLSGVWLGLSAKNLRSGTAGTVLAGCVVFGLLLL